MNISEYIDIYLCVDILYTLFSSTGQADPVTSHHPASQLTGSQLTGSQYSNSQYGDQAAKSFDQMTMSEHQS